MRQQTLGAWPDPATRFESFEPGPNRATLTALNTGESVWIHGPSGSGKTHLAHAPLNDRVGSICHWQTPICNRRYWMG